MTYQPDMRRMITATITISLETLDLDASLDRIGAALEDEVKMFVPTADNADVTACRLTRITEQRPEADASRRDAA